MPKPFASGLDELKGGGAGGRGSPQRLRGRERSRERTPPWSRPRSQAWRRRIVALGAAWAVVDSLTGLPGGIGAGRTLAAQWDPVPGVAGPGNGVVDGGGGLWDLASPNWSNDGGASNIRWTNGDLAVFGGNGGGIVTIAGGGVSASGLVFEPTLDLSTYTIAGQTPGDVLTLLSPALIADQDVTISAAIAGGLGLQKLGAGKLVLSSSGNTFGGGMTIGGGSVELRSDTAGGAGPITVQAGGTLANAGVSVANAITLSGGILESTGASDAAYTGPISVVATSAFVLPAGGRTTVLSGAVSGAGNVIFDGSGGGTLLVTNPAGALTGDVTLTGTGGTGGNARFARAINAASGQDFVAAAGTISLGNSVQGATVSLPADTTVQATGSGVVELSGRAATGGALGIGVSVGGNVIAVAGGRVVIGDGLDDSAQIQIQPTATLAAEGGRIDVNPRGPAALVLNGATVGAIAVRNGGTLAFGGNSDVVLDRDVNQAGTWTLVKRSPGTLTITGASQDNTEGLTLRAESGVIRLARDAVTVGAAAANGAVNVELRGGTIDINNSAPGKLFSYQAAAVVSGHGQLGTSAANQTHVVPAGGVAFHANLNGNASGTLNVVGGFNESAGARAAFRIGDNDGIALAVPNATPASAYRVNSVVLEPQSPGSVARFALAGGNAVANAPAFTGSNNALRFEVSNGATLISDVSQTGTLLVTGGSQGASVPISLAGGSTFVTTSPTFTLKASESVGGAGTLFAPNGTAVTALTLEGVVDLGGVLGGRINAASTGRLKLDAGETLVLGAAAEVVSMSLAYAGASAAPATLEVNAPGAVARIGTNAAIVTPYGPFGGTREFKATAGTLQIDAANAATVSISGVNTLNVDRTNNAVNDPTALGTLTLNGGSFQIGTTASTTTVQAGAVLSGRGTFGHTTALDTFINQGSVAASGGPLTISATSVRGSGTWNPSGQTLVARGVVADVGAGNPTQIRITGNGGGQMQIGGNNTYTGGTSVDGSGGTAPLSLRVTAAGSLGSGPVLLRSGGLLIRSDENLNFSTNRVTVTGGGTSQLDFARLGGSASGRSINIGALTIGDGSAAAPVLNVSGANSYTLNVAGITVAPSGGEMNITGSGGGATVNGNGLALQGDLSLSVGGSTYNVGALSGSGSVSRTFNSGTVIFNASAAPGFSGSVLTSGGTAEFRAANAVAGGRFTLGGGSYNVTTANALANASGTMSAGNLNLNVANVLAGTRVHLSNGTMFANVGAALANAVIDMTGGKLFVRADAPSSFGGAVSVSGDAASPALITLDRITAAGGGGQHTIDSLAINDQRLNLVSPTGYGLTVPGGTTIGPGDSMLSNDTPLFTTPTLQLNGNLSLIGFGVFDIGRLGGTGLISKSGSGTLNLNEPALPGFAGELSVDNGNVNLNTVAGALAGGSVTVESGTLNVGVANALAGVPTKLLSGFVNANVTNALAGTDIEVTNGSLRAAAPRSFGTNTVHLLGGNLTASAADALGPAAINIDGGILALRNDASVPFGGSVSISGTSFAAISVAPLSPTGPIANTLSINNLTINTPQLNVTGANDYTLAVLGTVTVPASGVTVNATASDVLFASPLNSTGGLTKTGVRNLTLDDGGTTGPVTVQGGELAVNGAWSASAVTVGGAGTPALLGLGGSGVNALPVVTVNEGTLRIAKPQPATAIPTTTQINGGADGDVTVEYAGELFATGGGTLANNILINTAAGPRKLTLSAASSGTSASSLIYTGGIATSGASALAVAARADTPLDDVGILVRAPSRVVLAANQSIPEVRHDGGIVVAKGNVAASGVSPFGSGANPIVLSQPDSMVGAMPADGQSVANVFKGVTTEPANAPRQRLGAFYNPSGAPATFHTLNFNGAFTWNNAGVPLYAPLTPGSGVASPANASWNGLFAEPGAILNINNGAFLDNILTTSGSTITSTAPIYAGGGGTIRLNSNFTPPRDLLQARGLGGTVSVLDDTVLESRSGSQNLFETVELLSGTYRVMSSNQRLAAGLAVGASPFDPSRTTSTLVTDLKLDVDGTAPGRQFRIGPGQTLVKMGTDAMNVRATQLHGANSTLAVNQGTVNLNTDAGSASQNNLSLSVGGATVNLATSQHLARIAITSGVARLAAGPTTGSRLIEATQVNVTGGQLDITNGLLAIDYAAGNSPAASIRQQIISAYDVAGPAHWTGQGITSSTAAADVTASTSIGYGEALDLLGPGGGTFGGEVVDASSFLVRYTKMGDANLDGTVGFADLVRLAQNYNIADGTALWSQADFTYDGNVNFQDLVILAQNYNTALGAPPLPAFPVDFREDLAGAFAQVPEPGAMPVIALCAACGLVRRRRKTKQHP